MADVGKSRFRLPSAAGPAALALLVCAGLYGAHRFGVYPAFDRLERERAGEDHRRVMETLRRELAQLGGETESWACWDDLCAYVEKPAPAFIAANLAWPIMESASRLNLAWICDRSGRVLYGRAYDSDLGGDLQFAALPTNSLAERPDLLAGSPGGRSFEGILKTEHGPVLLAGRPILSSQKKGPSRGTLLIGRMLDGTACEAIAGQTHVEFRLLSEGDPGLDERDLKRLHALKPGAMDLYRRADGGWTADGTFADLEGHPAFLIRSESRRDIAMLGARTTLLSFLLSLLVMLALSLAVVIGRERRRLAETPPAASTGSVAPPLTATALIGLAITAVTFFEAQRATDLGHRAAFAAEAARIAERIEEGFRLQLGHLESLSHFFLGSETVTRTEFREFVSPWLSEPGVRAMAWIPRVTESQRAEFEARQASPGGEPRPILERDTAGRAVVAARRESYLPVRYLEPLRSNEALLGLDLASDGVQRAAFGRGCDTGRPVVLLNPAAIGPAASEGLFLAALPLYEPSRPALNVADRRANLTGFVMLVGRADEIVHRAFRDDAPQDLTATVTEIAGRGRTSDLFSTRPPGAAPALLRHEREWRLGDRLWRVAVEAGPAYDADRRARLPWLIPPAGALLTGMGVMYLHALLTRRRRAEALVFARTQELRASEERLALALDGAELGIWDLDLPSGAGIINARWARMLGFEPEEVPAVATFWRERAHPADRTRLEQALQDHVEGRTDALEIECRLLARDGSWKWVLSKGRVTARDADGTARRIVGTHLDVTARRTAEEALRRRDTLLQAVNWCAERLLRSPPVESELPAVLGRLGAAAGVGRVGIFEARGGGGPTHVSIRHEWCRADVAPRSGESMLQDFDAVPFGLAHWVEALEAGRHVGGTMSSLPGPEADALRRLGVASLLVLPIFTDTRLWGVLTFSDDTGAREWSEPEIETFRTAAGAIGAALLRQQSDLALRDSAARVRQTQKLESLGVLAGGIAHDLNNMLTPILGNAELALMDLPPESPARTQIADVIQFTRRASELSRQMLAYSGRGRFVSQAFRLDTVVRDMTHLLEVSVSKRAVLRYDLAPSDATVQGDPTQIRQVILNLITNASEAIGERDGAIRLATGVLHGDRAYLRSAYLDENLPEGDYAFIEVADTGCGMDADTLGRVFDPFFTTKFTGRGLGLAVVLGIVRGHHGAIKVQSVPGQGTTFRVLLPVAGRPPDEDAARPEAAPDWRGHGTVLIVDDETDVRTTGAHFLERLGFTVLAAADGLEGVELFRRHAADIRAVLLDLTMPRMNGVEAAGAMRALRPDVPIVLCSGYSAQEVSGETGARNVTEFLEKPYTFNALRNLMRMLLPA